MLLLFLIYYSGRLDFLLLAHLDSITVGRGGGGINRSIVFMTIYTAVVCAAAAAAAAAVTVTCLHGIGLSEAWRGSLGVGSGRRLYSTNCPRGTCKYKIHRQKIPLVSSFSSFRLISSSPSFSPFPPFLFRSPVLPLLPTFHFHSTHSRQTQLGAINKSSI